MFVIYKMKIIFCKSMLIFPPQFSTLYLVFLYLNISSVELKVDMQIKLAFITTFNITLTECAK